MPPIIEKKILVIGEKSWPSAEDVSCLDFCELDIRGVRITESLDFECHSPHGEWEKIDAILWRGQFDSEVLRQYAVLNLIAASGVTCINSAASMLQKGGRISSYAALQRSGLPVIKSTFFCGSNGLSYYYHPDFPCVLKVGNWHMGYGKARAHDKATWLDAIDMAHIAKDFVGVEPFVTYTKDIRVLVLGDEVAGLERVPSQWKANVCPTECRSINVPESLCAMSIRAAQVLGMEILGVDWIQTRDGEWLLLEANPSPGLEWEGVDWRKKAIALLKAKTHGCY